MCVSPFFGTEGIEIVIVSLLLEIEKADVIRKFRASLLILLLYFVVYIDRGVRYCFSQDFVNEKAGGVSQFQVWNQRTRLGIDKKEERKLSISCLSSNWKSIIQYL